MTLPTSHDGLLADVRNTWESRGWDPAVLDTFRMGPEDDTQDDAKDDADDSGNGDQGTDDGDLDRRIAEARDQAAKQRLALKPWKDISKEFGVTPETAREMLANARKAVDDQPDLEQIRRDAERQATEQANRRVIRSELKVLARDIFADPDDAPLYVDLSKYEVDDEGDLVDRDQVLADLKRVTKDKPHLAKTPARPRPDASQGVRDTTKSGRDLGLAEAHKRFGTPAGTQ